MSRQFEKEVVFRAGVERVWQALTTPEQISKWMGHEVEELDLRPGGRFKVSGLHAATLTIVEPPYRLGWLWDPENGTEPGEETMTLTAVEGGTRLHVLSVSQGRWAESLIYFAGSEAGWLDWLEALEAFIATGAAVSGEPSGRLGAGFDADEQHGIQRVFVRRVAEGGPAEAAGIQPGDTLLAWNGRPIDRASTFWRMLWRTDAGANVSLTLGRGNQTVAVSLTAIGAKHS
jgi:uncharacterized protein YndB with AHSA1/START domain